MNHATRKTTLVSVTLLLAALLGASPVFAQQATKGWTNDDLTTPPTATQEWNYDDGANWSGGTVPADLDWVRLIRWTGSENVGGVALLDSDTNILATYRSGFGSKLYIDSSGNLRLDGTNTGGDGRVAIGFDGGSGDYVSIAAGGQISWAIPASAPAGSTLTNGYVQLSNNATLDTAGTIIAPLSIRVNSGSTMNINGGIIEAHLGHSSIQVGGSLNQSGGAIQNTDILQLLTGTYTISGGSVAASATNGLQFRYATATEGGTIHVDGSGASGITFNGLRHFTAEDRENSTWKFTLDNGANHITPVNLTVNGTTGATLRNLATLEVGLQGGVLLSGTDTFTLITRPSGTDEEWGTGPGALWTDSTTGDGSEIRVTLAGAAQQGTLDAAIEKNRLELGGQSQGYITLTDVGNDLQIGLDFGNSYDVQDLDLFKTALTDAGIDWTTGYGVYAIGLFLDPTISGGNYFAWDLSSYGDLQLVGIANVIPEPSSLLLLGLAGLALLRRRR